MTEQERARAVIYGLAVGDAMGYPIEFLKMNKISIIYGPFGIQEPPKTALYSDDTQTSIAVAEALIEAGDQDVESIMKVFTRRLIAWSNSPENTRHPGHTVTEAVRTLEAGVHWKEAGSNAKGNGSAIRVAPIGYFYQQDPDRLREVAHATGIATHNNETATAAAIAAAYLVKCALDGVLPEQYVNRARDFTRDLSQEFDDWMLRVGHVLAWTDENAALRHIGAGWQGHELVALAVYCAARHDGDFVTALQRAVNTDGDSDSIGSVTGSLMAARMGIEAIPPEWINRLERLQELTDVADRLAAAKEKIYGAK
jgi:ADP-ribosylglycohydrolase